MTSSTLQPVAAPLDALLTSAAFAPINNLGWLRVTGSDRVRWLNGMTTNNVAALAPGRGCYTFFLNAQGRILADATAFLLEDSILLETASPGTLATLLDHFIIMDDVELQVIPATDRTGLLLAGPAALDLLHRLDFAASLQPLQLETTRWEAHELTLLHAHSPLVPAYELWSTPGAIAQFTSALLDLSTARATPDSLHQLRILSGTPLYGTDIRNTDTARDLPQETNQTHALHFAKGCYLGQEIVERIRSRGAVHRTFTGFILHGEPPTTLPTPITAGTPEKAVGELTSVVSTPFGLRALGYIRREILSQHESDPAARIQYPGGLATPATLPFHTESLNRES